MPKGFQKGYTPWNKGRACPELGINRSTAHLAEHQFQSGFTPWNKGKKGSQKAWNKGVKGAQVAWNKGRSWSKESREKMRLAKLGKPGNRKGKTKFSDGVNTNGYHPFWRDIRKIVYKRDGWLCRECGVHCKNQGLHQIACHHIDYDKTHNDLSNLVTLCKSCHQKTNFNRVDWIARYSLTQKEMGVNAPN